MTINYRNPRTLEQSYAERDELLANSETAHSIGGRKAQFQPDDTPFTIIFALSDGPASRGGTFGFELDQAEILYRQLGALLGKDES